MQPMVTPHRNSRSRCKVRLGAPVHVTLCIHEPKMVSCMQACVLHHYAAKAATNGQNGPELHCHIPPPPRHTPSLPWHLFASCLGMVALQTTAKRFIWRRFH